MFAVDPNAVMQQFSPLFMSQWFLIDQAKNPCSSITCENGFLYVFKHVSKYSQTSIILSARTARILSNNRQLELLKSYICGKAWMLS